VLTGIEIVRELGLGALCDLLSSVRRKKPGSGSHRAGRHQARWAQSEPNRACVNRVFAGRLYVGGGIRQLFKRIYGF